MRFSLVFLFSLFLSTALKAQVTSTITCSHFQLSKVVENIDFIYTHKGDRSLHSDVLVKVYPTENNIIEPSNYSGEFEFDYPMSSAIEGVTVFEGCVNCDYDRAEVSFFYDDNYELLGVLEYVSDGPVLLQILKCKES